MVAGSKFKLRLLNAIWASKVVLLVLGDDAQFSDRCWVVSSIFVGPKSFEPLNPKP